MEERSKQEKANELARLTAELESTKAELEKERALREDAENKLALANSRAPQVCIFSGERRFYVESVVETLMCINFM